MPKYSIPNYRIYNTQIKTSSYIQRNTQYFNTTKYYQYNVEYYETSWDKMYTPSSPNFDDINLINSISSVNINCFLIRKEMIISIEHDDEAENEISLELCCPHCANTRYNVPIEKFEKLKFACEKGKISNVPANVNDGISLAKFIISS